MNTASLRIALLCVPLAALAGCSVDGVDQVFGRSPGGASGNGGASGEGGQTTSGPTTTDTTTSGPGTTTTTSGPSTTTTTTSGPTTTTTTNSGPSTSTGMPIGPTVSCNNSPCDAGQVCCFYQFQEGQDFCADPGTCPGQQGWFEISCNGPDDCNGGVCCGLWNNQIGWYQISCEANCDQGLTMCTGDPGVCDGGTTCNPSGALGQGYSYCGN